MRMKTAISIPDALFQAAERVARRLGVSRSELYRRALRTFLGDHREDGVTEKLNEIYDTAGESAGIDPVLAQLQASSLPRDEW
jgi:metal-responsive CopG/Arc/MetJ family transcriptional regulator